MMPLYDGTLSDWAYSTPADIQRCFCSLLRALDFLSSRGLVHRDVKPGNIFWKRRAGVGQFALGDLHTVAPPPARGDAGTFVFQPPEVLARDTRWSPASDLWSLALSIGTALTGDNARFPTEMWGSVATREAAAAAQPREWDRRREALRRAVVAAGMSPAASWVLRRLLSLDPRLRGTAAEALADLARGQA